MTIDGGPPQGILDTLDNGLLLLGSVEMIADYGVNLTIEANDLVVLIIRVGTGAVTEVQHGFPHKNSACVLISPSLGLANLLKVSLVAWQLPFIGSSAAGVVGTRIVRVIQSVHFVNNPYPLAVTGTGVFNRSHVECNCAFERMCRRIGFFQRDAVESRCVCQCIGKWAVWLGR